MDWGTVPAWVGSILTAGSLTLGFYIILRDKKTAEKEQIQKLITREVSNRTKKSPYSSKTLVMTNASDSPFYDVHGAMHGLFLTSRRSVGNCGGGSSPDIGRLGQRRDGVLRGSSTQFNAVKAIPGILNGPKVTIPMFLITR